VSHSNRKPLKAGLLLIFLLPAIVTAAQDATETEYTGALRDAWLDGKIETAFLLNRYLNPLEIDTRVDQGVAYLSGTVTSNVQRILAGDIAERIEGVVGVENNLFVDPGKPGAADPISYAFIQTIDDATTTALVKTQLLANEDTQGLDINVDTENDVVTLTGEVVSEEEKALAEAIAMDTADTRIVINELTIREQ